MVTVVKINYEFNRLNGLDLVSVNVHPIERTAIEVVEGRICRNYLNGRSIHTGINFDKSNYYRLVTHVVADLKLNTVNTVSNSYITDSHSAIVKGYRNFNTVNVCLGGRCIQPGSICLSGVFLNCYRNRKKITLGSNCNVLFKCSSFFGFKKLNITEYRRFSIINRIREICSNVIDINSLKTVYSSVFLPKIICVGMGEHKLDKSEVISIIFRSIVCNLILAIKTGDKYLAIRTYVDREVSPTRRVYCVIDFRLINNRYCILAFKLSVTIGIIPIENTNPAMLILIGNISPESDGFGILYNNSLIKEEVGLTVST